MQWRFFIVTLDSYDIYVIHPLKSLLIAKYICIFDIDRESMVYRLFKTI